MITETLLLNPIIMAKIICDHDIIKQNHLDTLINLPFMDNNIETGVDIPYIPFGDFKRTLSSTTWLLLL